jgi:hypothetical protein
MKKKKVLLISILSLSALTLATAAAPIGDDCGYNRNGEFRLGNGQVAAFGTWDDARQCAIKGILPSIVNKRLGNWGGLDTRQEAAQLRTENSLIKRENAEG